MFRVYLNINFRFKSFLIPSFTQQVSWVKQILQSFFLSSFLLWYSDVSKLQGYKSRFKYVSFKLDQISKPYKCGESCQLSSRDCQSPSDVSRPSFFPILSDVFRSFFPSTICIISNFTKKKVSKQRRKEESRDWLDRASTKKGIWKREANFGRWLSIHGGYM